MDLIDRDVSHLVHPRQLREPVRMIIGLMIMGVPADDMAELLLWERTELSPEESKALLLAERQDLEAFCRMLRASRHPVIMGALKGMAPDCAGTIPNAGAVVCPSCKARVYLVPCVACSVKRMWHSRPSDDKLTDSQNFEEGSPPCPN